VDPETIPLGKKVVKPTMSMGQLSIYETAPKPFGLVQLSGSNITRRPTPERLKSTLERLVKEVPGTWIGLHDIDDENTQAAREVPGIQVSVNLPFDELVGLTAAAKLTISPDSFLTHLRGSMGLPGISIFGPHDPMLRTRYYPGIKPLWERQACVNSPCLVYKRVFPRYLCPPLSEPRKECAVIGAGYDRLIETVKGAWGS
jgi:ADP-heptose:LPS heptosyltransferase